MIVRVPDLSIALFNEQRDQLHEAIGALWLVWARPNLDLAITGADAARTEDLLRAYEPTRRAAARQAARAEARGDTVFTLEVDLPPHASEDLAQLLELLDKVDALCDAELLAPPASPEIRAFRRTMLDTMAEQLRRPQHDAT